MPKVLGDLTGRLTVTRRAECQDHADLAIPVGEPVLSLLWRSRNHDGGQGYSAKDC